jgi:hypothetical protein
MTKELDTLSNKLNESLATATGIALTAEQVKEIAERLLEDGYRLTEPTGSFIAQRPDGQAKRTEDLDRANQFAGKDGHVLQRRTVIAPFDQIDSSTTK